VTATVDTGDRWLAVVLAALIPEDEQPGAASPTLARYVIDGFGGDDATEGIGLAEALDRIGDEARERFGISLPELGEGEVVSLLVDLERGQTNTDWPDGLDPTTVIGQIVELTVEAFYAVIDPTTATAPGWAVVGYRPRSL
jgi:hypothetical protein